MVAVAQDSLIETFLHDLAGRVRGDLRSDTYSRMLYSTDASIYQIMPHGVFLPQDADDMQAAVEAAARHGVAIMARGGGSSLAGQAVNAALMMDSSRHMNQVLELNQAESWVRVQPGIVLDQLNAYLRPHGLQFGPDPASSNRAVMGGIVSNNSTGSHSIMYGMTADHVLAANVILSDGSAVRFEGLNAEQTRQAAQKNGLEGSLYREMLALSQDPAKAAIIRANTPRHWRRCGGYNLDRLIDLDFENEFENGNGAENKPSFLMPQDGLFNLAKLICGAEGTLGIITELKLNLVPIPKQTALAIVQFDSLYEALAATPTILEVEPSAVELLDNLALTMCHDVPQYVRLLKTFLQGEPHCILITEFYGENQAELDAKLTRLGDHLRAQSVNGTAIPLHNLAQQAAVWTVRKVGLGLMMSVKGDVKPVPFIEDAAVPVEHLAEYVTKVEQFCNDIGTNVAYYAHASAGCIHIRPLLNTKIASEVAKIEQIMQFSVDLLKGYGGALSSEHGDGRVRSWMNERFFGPDLYKLYQDVKQVFDPHNILNPDMVVNAIPYDQHLRYGERYQVIELKEHIDFSADGGFARAVEMCNGAGVCRKQGAGTMCPSFMVTQEEEHSTRGRANALRAAMAGIIPTEELTSPRMHGVMDLCISCKACKAECPSSVDMGKIKFEFLAQYNEANGTPLRSRIFGDIARLSRLSSGALAPLANFSLKNPLVRAGMTKVLGISSERTLPSFARQPFTTWFKRHKPTHKADAQRVVLFNDTFNTYNYPHVSIAATEFLEAAGFAIQLPGHKCCGRPMISKGLVDQARAAAADTVAKLAPLARQGLPIIGLEPSCILTLRDEYHYLLPDNPDVKLVADHAFTFEEFISAQAESGALADLQFKPEARQILLHGHCHQKALVGTAPSKTALTLPPNYSLTEVDSGCCGMAGSFGYEAEHYETSMQMAERRLLPTVRAAERDTIIVAAGVSCRQQIKHGAEKRALHPAEVLRDALV